MMKTIVLLFLASSLAALAATEEEINRRFPAQAGGKLVVDVEFGTVTVTSHAAPEVVVDVYRKVSRRSKAEEERYLTERPVTFREEGSTLVIVSRGPKPRWLGWWRGRLKTEGQYTIQVPARFNLELKTAGGSVAATDIAGEIQARTSGGGLRFERVRGPIDGHTSGGSIHVRDAEGTLRVRTSGGGIELSGGAGSFAGHTSGGSIKVVDFQGPVEVETSGGGLTIQQVAGKVIGATSGGSISARFAGPISDEIRLQTSGGGVTLVVPSTAALDLDASTSGGGVSSDLPITILGKASRDQLRGSINGGGKRVVLRSSGGSIRVRKL